MPDVCCWQGLLRPVPGACHWHDLSRPLLGSCQAWHMKKNKTKKRGPPETSPGYRPVARRLDTCPGTSQARKKTNKKNKKKRKAMTKNTKTKKKTETNAQRRINVTIDIRIQIKQNLVYISQMRPNDCSAIHAFIKPKLQNYTNTPHNIMQTKNGTRLQKQQCPNWNTTIRRTQTHTQIYIYIHTHRYSPVRLYMHTMHKQMLCITIRNDTKQYHTIPSHTCA